MREIRITSLASSGVRYVGPASPVLQAMPFGYEQNNRTGE